MKNLYKVLLLLLIPANLMGQLTPVANHYLLDPLTINPAYAGSRGALSMAAFYWKQWVGIAGAPETMTLSMDAPLKDKKIGLGLMLVSDKVGATKETQINTSYAYRIDVKDGVLAFGLGAGIGLTNTAYSKLYAIDAEPDGAYTTDSKLFVVPNFSFGVNYTYRNYFVGLSIPAFLSYSFDYAKNKYTLINDVSNYNYLFNTGYLFEATRNFRILPSALIRYSIGEKILYDINLQFNFLEKFWVGASYRNGRSVATLFQFEATKQLKMAYTYDFDIGDIGTYSNGSHEIMLRYEFRYRVDVVNPLIF